MKHTVAVVLALALVVGIQACGGDDGESATGPDRSAESTGEELSDGGSGSTANAGDEGNGSTAQTAQVARRRVNAACGRIRAAFQAEFQELQAEGGAGIDEGSLIETAATDIAIPRFEQEVELLRGVSTESETEEGFEDLATAIEGLVKEVEEDPEGFVTAADPYEAIQPLADEYGISACGAL